MIELIEETNEIQNSYFNIHDMHNFQEINLKAISYNDLVNIHVLLLKLAHLLIILYKTYILNRIFASISSEFMKLACMNICINN